MTEVKLLFLLTNLTHFILTSSTMLKPVLKPAKMFIAEHVI